MSKFSFRSAHIAVFILFLIGVGFSSAAEKYSPYRPTMQAGDAYIIDALLLHPTQFSLGFREVAHKTKMMNRMSAARLEAYLKHKNVPVVIGPGGVPYLTDGHHTIRALINSDVEPKTVYGHIIANWSTLSTKAFWQRMELDHYTYLKDCHGNGPLNPRLLPENLLKMESDPYRSLAWALLHHGVYRELEGKSCYFQEFYWADFLRSRVHWNTKSDKDFRRAVSVAEKIARSPAASALPGYVSNSGSRDSAMASINH